MVENDKKIFLKMKKLADYRKKYCKVWRNKTTLQIKE